MERFSISISSRMKKQLGLMARANFRNLNGEINKALDDYIRKNGTSVVEDAMKIGGSVNQKGKNVNHSNT